mmetsp:Transcript_97/g.166  ORF Transcript_97/g.166 Transcript_97/m.166 type:complete len:328 (-) Transcript_97:528-1511(-)
MTKLSFRVCFWLAVSFLSQACQGSILAAKTEFPWSILVVSVSQPRRSLAPWSPPEVAAKGSKMLSGYWEPALQLRGGTSTGSTLAVEEEGDARNRRSVPSATNQTLEQQIEYLRERLADANKMMDQDTDYIEELSNRMEAEQSLYQAQIKSLSQELKHIKNVNNMTMESNETLVGIAAMSSSLEHQGLPASNQRWMAEQLGRVDNQVRRLKAEITVLKNNAARRRAAHRVACERHKAQSEEFVHCILSAREKLRRLPEDDCTKEQLLKARKETMDILEGAVFGEGSIKLDYSKWDELSLSEEDEIETVPEPPPPGFLERYLHGVGGA